MAAGRGRGLAVGGEAAEHAQGERGLRLQHLLHEGRVGGHDVGGRRQAVDGRDVGHRREELRRQLVDGRDERQGALLGLLDGFDDLVADGLGELGVRGHGGDVLLGRIGDSGG